MKKFNTLLTYVSSNRIWLITLGCLDLFFAFLAWVAYQIGRARVGKECRSRWSPYH